MTPRSCSLRNLSGGLALVFLIASCAAEEPAALREDVASAPAISAVASAAPPGNPALRIRFYEAKLAEHPDLFAGHAELGAAYLDLARETHDPDALQRARRALERSLEIQPNPNALVTLAAACNFSHRFACALEHAQSAARADPGDERIRPLLVEAHLGLGALSEAGRLVEEAASPDASFAAAATRGRCLAEQERHD